MSRWEQIAGKPLEPLANAESNWRQESSQIAFEQALESLVYDCLGWQLFVKDDKKTMPRMRWLLENCTVRMQLHRKSGQTTSLIRVASRIFERPVFIFHSMDFADRARKQFGINKTQAYSIQILWGPVYPECICVDNASLFDQKQIEHVYNLADQDTKCLILMG